MFVDTSMPQFTSTETVTNYHVRVLRFWAEDRQHVTKDDVKLLLEHGIIPVFTRNTPSFVEGHDDD